MPNQVEKQYGEKQLRKKHEKDLNQILISFGTFIPFQHNSLVY